MERLTTYICGYAHGAEGVREDSLTGNYCRGEFEATAIVDRLAAYEDTGLEPEEIARILDAYGRGMTLRTENAQRLEIVKGIQTDRLRELAQADRGGRCVVLPAKPDQTIYQWRIGDDCPSVSRLDGVQINADGEITYPIWNGYLIAEDFGRTVFLTREEAALRREQDG
jgi:hypothetical protein